VDSEKYQGLDKWDKEDKIQAGKEQNAVKSEECPRPNKRKLPFDFKTK
jgi:hypothetical protein